MSTTTSSRLALAPLSTSKLNISHNSKSRSFGGYSKSKSSSLYSPVRASKENVFKIHSFNSFSGSVSVSGSPSFKKSLHAGNSNRLNRSNTSSFKISKPKNEISPRMERAKNLKLKLQLAYYKVKTNQTGVPLQDLKLPLQAPTPTKSRRHNNSYHSYHSSNTLDAFNQCSNVAQNAQNVNAIADLLAASTPLLMKKVNAVPPKSFKFSKVSVLSTGSTRSSKNSHKCFLDEVVNKKATCANLKRASLEFFQATKSDCHNGNNHHHTNECSRSGSSSPTSAPSHITNFNLGSLPTPTTASTSSNPVQATYLHHHLLISNQTSPSKFVISRPELNREPVSYKTSVKLPPISKFFDNESTKQRCYSLPTPSTTTTGSASTTPSTVTTSSNHQHTESDSTILQNTSSLLLMTTPVGKSKSFAGSSTNSIMGRKSRNINQQSNTADETQLMSSPTRLLSTPSSIGAARCLLQLSKR
ncbi:unnamed protein product [Ambrosiozyma monospora]|uniref:Unnamed protein product n=1 Tax=Ambrosiozyma monospora TaxID=43982 RepID=A0A9W6YVT6_AMBMO|nr:unnamed protein product [Ambrosiozyma monospora]